MRFWAHVAALIVTIGCGGGGPREREVDAAGGADRDAGAEERDAGAEERDAGAGGDGGPGLSAAARLATTYRPVGALFVRGGWVFWSSAGDDDADESIWRVPVEGGEPQELVRGSRFTALAAVSDQYIFWDPGGNRVMRADLDGSNSTDLAFAPDSLWLADRLDLGPEPGTLIGSSLPDGQTGRLVELPMQGGAARELAPVRETFVGADPDVVIDGAEIYFTDRPEGAPDAIRRVIPDGGSEVVVANDAYPDALGDDPEYLYWDEDGDLMRRAKTGGAPDLLYADWSERPYCVRGEFIYFIDGFLDETQVWRLSREPEEGDTPDRRLAIDAHSAGPDGGPTYPYRVVCGETRLFAAAAVESRPGTHVLLAAPYP